MVSDGRQVGGGVGIYAPGQKEVVFKILLRGDRVALRGKESSLLGIYWAET